MTKRRIYQLVLLLLLNLLFKSKADKLSNNNNEMNNRELLEYLMQASSSNAISQLAPGYFYNSVTEENQLELPVSSPSNISGINNEEIMNTTYPINYHNYANDYMNTYQDLHQLNQLNHKSINQLKSPLINNLDRNLNVSSKSVNLTQFLESSQEDQKELLNKQSKSSDFSLPINNYLYGHMPIHSKLYRMAAGRKEPFKSRAVSNLFGKPRKMFPEIKSIDLMKSAADIPSTSASYYMSEGESDDASQIPVVYSKSAVMRNYPTTLYHQATNYGQYYAEDPRQAYYHQMRDYYDSHGHDMTYGKSDFYWLIPIAFLIGAGALLLPIISVFMTTLVTSGTLTLNAGRRKKRDVDFLFGEFKNLIGEDAYTKLEDLYWKLQKSIDQFAVKDKN